MPEDPDARPEEEAAAQPAVAPAEPDAATPSSSGVEIPLPPPADATARCPWCSAPLPDPGVASCPACGANLAGPEDADILGVTKVDPVLLAYARRPKERPRRTLAGWITGDPTIEDPRPSKEELPALAPPDRAVLWEMRRIELESLGVVLPPDEPPAVAAGGAASDASEPEAPGGAGVADETPGAEAGDPPGAPLA